MKELNLGQKAHGGYFIGIMTDPQGNEFNMIVSPKKLGEIKTQWKVKNTWTNKGSSKVDGFYNTLKLTSSDHPAGKFISNLDIGGFNDWYFPSIKELETLVRNKNYLPSDQGFNETYWSSSENSDVDVFGIDFDLGYHRILRKGVKNYFARAIRAVPI